jgi:hypothetical protein
VTNINELLRAAAADLPDNPALAEQVVARGRRHRLRVRAAGGCAAVVVAAVGGPLTVKTLANVGGGGIDKITISAAPGSRMSNPRPTGAQNLLVDDFVRNGLATAWAAGQRLQRSDVAGTRKGSVFYAYDPSSAKYWAIADFEPSASALAKHGTLNGGNGDPLIQFQDGPFIFSRSAGGSWTLVGDTGGGPICPRVPAAVIAVWHLPRC